MKMKACLLITALFFLVQSTANYVQNQSNQNSQIKIDSAGNPDIIHLLEPVSPGPPNRSSVIHSARLQNRGLQGNSTHKSGEEESHAHRSRGELVLLLIFSTLIGGAAIRFSLDALGIDLPYTCIIFLAGCILGGVTTTYTEKFSTFSQAVHMVASVDPHLLLYIFLPPLIFESASNMDFFLFLKLLPSVLILAIPGLAICILLTGVFVKTSIYPAWAWTHCFLFGSVLSATDPVAVVALLTELGVSKRLALVIEGESLLNDGTAMVIFLSLKHPGPFRGLGSLFLDFISMGIGGSVFGWLLGAVTLGCIGRVFNDPQIEITLMVSVAYLAFYIAEAELHWSGVLAVVALGVRFAGFSHTKVSPEIAHFLREFWEMLAFVCNTLVFVLAGILTVARNFKASDWQIIGADDWLALFLLYAVSFTIRGFMMLVFKPLFRALGTDLSFAELAVCTWGGLRGAVGLALALVLLVDDNLSRDTRTRMFFHCSGLVCLTLVINAPTMRWVLFRVGLMRVSKAHLILEQQAHSAIQQELGKTIEDLKKSPFHAQANWNLVRHFVGLEEKQHSSKPKILRKIISKPMGQSMQNVRDGARDKNTQRKDMHQHVQHFSSRRKISRRYSSTSSIPQPQLKPRRMSAVEIEMEMATEVRKTACLILKASFCEQFSKGHVGASAFDKLTAELMHFMDNLQNAEEGLSGKHASGRNFLPHNADPPGVVRRGRGGQTEALHKSRRSFTRGVSAKTWRLMEHPPVLRWASVASELTIPAYYRMIPSQRGLSKPLDELREAEESEQTIPKTEGCSLVMDHVKELADRMLYRKLTFGIDMANAFVVGFEAAKNQLKFFGNRHADEVSDALAVEIIQAQAALHEMSNTFPEVFSSISSKHCARILLRNERTQVQTLAHKGLLNDKQRTEMTSIIERRMKVLAREPPWVTMPSKEELLKEVPWVRNLPSMAFKSVMANTHIAVVAKDGVLVRQDDLPSAVYILVRGIVGVHVQSAMNDYGIEHTPDLKRGTYKAIGSAMKRVATIGARPTMKDDGGSSDGPQTDGGKFVKSMRQSFDFSNSKIQEQSSQFCRGKDSRMGKYVATLGAGVTIGESSLLTGTLCSASVVAENVILAFRIDAEPCRRMMNRHRSLLRGMWDFASENITSNQLIQLPQYRGLTTYEVRLEVQRSWQRFEAYGLQQYVEACAGPTTSLPTKKRHSSANLLKRSSPRQQIARSTPAFFVRNLADSRAADGISDQTSSLNAAVTGTGTTATPATRVTATKVAEPGAFNVAEANSNCKSAEARIIRRQASKITKLLEDAREEGCHTSNTGDANEQRAAEIPIELLKRKAHLYGDDEIKTVVTRIGSTGVDSDGESKTPVDTQASLPNQEDLCTNREEASGSQTLLVKIVRRHMIPGGHLRVPLEQDVVLVHGVAYTFEREIFKFNSQLQDTSDPTQKTGRTAALSTRAFRKFPAPLSYENFDGLVSSAQVYDCRTNYANKEKDNDLPESGNTSILNRRDAVAHPRLLEIKIGSSEFHRPNLSRSNTKAKRNQQVPRAQDDYPLDLLRGAVVSMAIQDGSTMGEASRLAETVVEHRAPCILPKAEGKDAIFIRGSQFMLPKIEENDPRDGGARNHWIKLLREVKWIKACIAKDAEGIDEITRRMAKREYNYSKDAVLIASDKPYCDTDRLLLVTRGLIGVRVCINGIMKTVSTMGPGATIGEMALLTHGRTTAAVVAQSDVTVRAVTYFTLHQVFDSHPEILHQLWAMTGSRMVNNMIAANHAFNHRPREVLKSYVDSWQFHDVEKHGPPKKLSVPFALLKGSMILYRYSNKVEPPSPVFIQSTALPPEPASPSEEGNVASASRTVVCRFEGPHLLCDDVEDLVKALEAEEDLVEFSWDSKLLHPDSHLHGLHDLRKYHQTRPRRRRKSNFGIQTRRRSQMFQGATSHTIGVRKLFSSTGAKKKNKINVGTEATDLDVSEVEERTPPSFVSSNDAAIDT